MNPRHRKTADLTLGFLSLGVSPSPLEVIEAAAQAGFGAAGPRVCGRYPDDGWPWPQDDAALRDIRELAARRKVRISSVSGYYISPRVALEHLLHNVKAAQAVGAPLIMQGCFEADAQRLAALLRDYGAAARRAGVRIALEFMPMSELKTIAAAQAAIAASGADNIGLLVDTLHLVRSGATAADVAALAPSEVCITQLCDAPARLAPGMTLFDEAMSGRMYLGDGELDLAAVVRALPPRAELELETPVVADAALPLARRATLAAEKAQRFFDRHFGA